MCISPLEIKWLLFKFLYFLFESDVLGKKDDYAKDGGPEVV